MFYVCSRAIIVCHANIGVETMDLIEFFPGWALTDVFMPAQEGSEPTAGRCGAPGAETEPHWMPAIAGMTALRVAWNFPCKSLKRLNPRPSPSVIPAQAGIESRRPDPSHAPPGRSSPSPSGCPHSRA